jgi:nitronate monooxygenase
MSWSETRITTLLGTPYPLIQAPMAGITTPEMAAAVSEAGALGSLGGAMLSPEKLREQIDAVRSVTHAPLNVNLFAPVPQSDPGDSIEEMLQALAPWRESLGLGPPTPPRRPGHTAEDLFGVVLDEKPEVFSFTFGIPPQEVVDAAREAGIKVFGTATTVGEAELLEQAHCDAVVAQGSEAGGHRGTFASDFEQGMIGTLALVPQIADRVDCPVIAAGGIMDGRGIAAALALGADAVQLGTAFLAVDESGAPAPYKESLSGAVDTDTVVTRAFTGRPLRGLRTRFVDEIEASGKQIPPYPLQAGLLAELREAGLEQGRLDVVGRLVGQGVPCIRGGSAGELVRLLVEETEAAVKSLQD